MILELFVLFSWVGDVVETYDFEALSLYKVIFTNSESFCLIFWGFFLGETAVDFKTVNDIIELSVALDIGFDSFEDIFDMLWSMTVIGESLTVGK